MRTTTKGRSGSTTRSGWGSQGFSSYGTTKRTGRTRGATTATGYGAMSSTCAQKIQSWKNILNQTRGPASCKRPTPAQLNTFANWVNKGAVVQTVTAAKVNKWAMAKNKTFTKTSPASCKNVLAAKFGKNAIKAVCLSKTGSFIVATAPTVKGKPFQFPK